MTVGVEHLPRDTTPARVAEALQRDGAVVIDGLDVDDHLGRIAAEMQPWMAATRPGPDGFTGRHTRRTGGLLARSPASHAIVRHPLVLDTAKRVLAHAQNFQLHLTQIIAIGAGEQAQPVHRDQWAFDFFPFPPGYDVQCNTIWAMTDFTESNGATRVVPGSHLMADKLQFTQAESVPAEMERGSVLVYNGRIYHGGGANRSGEVRMGLNVTYALGWLRQEENQYLSVPPEIARTFDDELLKLIGYARGAYALGYVDDLRDPLAALRDDRTQAGMGELRDVAPRLKPDA